MLHAQGGGEALLLLGGDVGFGDAAALAFVDEGLQLGVVLCGQGRQRVFGGHRHVGGAHQRIGAGGEDLHHTFVADAGDVVGKLISMPRDLPIQLRCMVLTCSGQPSSSSRLSSSSSA